MTNDGSLGLTQAAADYFYTSTESLASYTLSLGNLTEGATINLDVWTSRQSNSSGIGFYEYSIDGGVNWLGFDVMEKDGTPSVTDNWDSNDTQGQTYQAQRDGNNNARYMNVDGVTIGSAESVIIRARDSTSGNWTSIGALRLTVVPEPSAYALILGLVVAGCGLCRRR